MKCFLIILADVFIIFNLFAQNVTIPNTFSSGTTAKAQEVNQDFDTLVKALPGVNWRDMDRSTTITSRTNNTIVQCSMTPPSDGYIVGNLNVNVKINGTINDVNKYIMVFVGLDQHVSISKMAYNYFTIDDLITSAWGYRNLRVESVIPVKGGTTYTFSGYIGYVDYKEGTNATISVYTEGGLVLEYFPNKY